MHENLVLQNARMARIMSVLAIPAGVDAAVDGTAGRKWRVRDRRRLEEHVPCLRGDRLSRCGSGGCLRRDGVESTADHLLQHAFVPLINAGSLER